MIQLTSAEWAAWVQSVGSVLAIIAAIAIAWWQLSRANANRERERKERDLERGFSAYVFGALFSSSLGPVKLSVEANFPAYTQDNRARELKQNAHELRDLQEWSRTIDISTLPVLVGYHLVRMRALIPEVLALCDQAPSIEDGPSRLWRVDVMQRAHRDQLIDALRVAGYDVASMQQRMESAGWLAYQGRPPGSAGEAVAV